MKRDYNSERGILQYLTSLEGLHELIRDRHEAYYVRGERLSEFLVLGHWGTDSCGNWGKATLHDDEYKNLKVHKEFPAVLPYSAFKMRLFGVHGILVAYDGNVHVPPANMKCCECGKLWTLENAWDVFVSNDNKLIEPPTNISLADCKVKLAADTEEQIRFCSYTKDGYKISNLKYVDKTPHPSPRYEGQLVNEHGTKIVGDDYLFQEGDKVYCKVSRFAHKACHNMRQGIESRDYFTKVFNDAGFCRFVMSEIKNEYCPCEICSPWQTVRTVYGVIKIGRRKSVINIDWSDTGMKLSSLFQRENVTKGEHFIHAHNTDKAVEYLGKILVALANESSDSKKDEPAY